MTIALRQRPLARVVQGIVQAGAGCWLDPSDLSTLYQDAAGTTPVTAVEQPVGKILDKSGNSNHATQSITASRPTLSARYNLLTNTEDFSNAAWVKEFGGTGSTPVITQNYATAPDGSNTATRIVYALNGGAEHTDFSRVYQPVTLPANTQTVVGVWVKSTTGQAKNISISMTGANPLVVTVGADWVFVSNAMIRSDNNYLLRFELRGLYGTSDSADILIWHPDLRLGTTAGPYQRVNTATDYDTDERYFPKYLKFDGIDDYLSLPYMGLYANGRASVVMAIARSKTGTIKYAICEGSSSGGNGYIPLRLSDTGVTSRIVNDAGTVMVITPESAGSASSIPEVLSFKDTGSTFTLHKNGSQTNSTDYTRAGSVTLNTLTIGAISQATATENMLANLYSLIITKSALTDAQRIKCERYAASKAGVIL